MDYVTAPNRVPRKPKESGFAARARNEMAAEAKRKRKARTKYGKVPVR